MDAWVEDLLERIRSTDNEDQQREILMDHINNLVPVDVFFTLGGRQ